MTACAGRAPRSTWIQPPPSPGASVRAHSPTSFASRAELGTSRTMLHTSLSAKKSSPVNCKLFFAPSTSQKKGSLRQPAKKRVSPASVTFASRPNETGARSTIISPPSPVPAACGPSTRRTLAVCAPRSKAEKAHSVGDIGNRITIGINLELVQCFGCERLRRRGPRRVFACGRMHVYDQDRFSRLSRFGKGIQIGEVQSGVSLREAEVRARIVMRHGLVLLSCRAVRPPGLERGGTGRSDGMILIAGTTADADRPYDLAIQLQRDAASKNHDFAVV